MAGTTIQETAKDQANKAIAFVQAAKEQAKASGRSIREELEDIMLMRLTGASLDKTRARGAVWGLKESQNMLQIFIQANENEHDPEAIIKRLASLSNNMTEAAKSVQNGETNVPA